MGLVGHKTSVACDTKEFFCRLGVVLERENGVSYISKPRRLELYVGGLMKLGSRPSSRKRSSSSSRRGKAKYNQIVSDRISKTPLAKWRSTQFNVVISNETKLAPPVQ